MAQRTYLDLVDVEFKDLTNHEQTPDRSDIMGIILSYPWGPVEKPILYDKEGFFSQYPESLPADMSPKSQYWDATKTEWVSVFAAHQFDAWLQCKQFFANGGRQVEVLNTLGSKRYVGGFTDNGLTFQGSSDTSLLKGKYFLGLVYPGLPTADHVGFNHIGLQLRVTTPSATSDRCTVEVVAYTGGTADDPSGDIVVESFQGQWYDEGKLQQGQLTHFVHVLKKSKFIRCYNTEDMDFTAIAGSFEEKSGYSGIFVPASYETDPGNSGNVARVSVLFKSTASQGGTTYDASICSMLAQDPTTAAAIKDPNLCNSVADRNASYAYKYLKYFGNIDKTHATIVVGPVSAEFNETNLIAKAFHGVTTVGNAILAYNKVLMNIGEYCMTRMAFVPMYSQVSSGNIIPWVHDELAQAIYGPSAGAETILPKFTNLIQGYEQVTFGGVRYPLDCCGGVAGAYANIAKTVRVNQVASARTYGAYKGRLLNDPEFDDVLDNHDSGIITVYNGAAGPEIFGVHNAGYLEDPNSYFATNNVSRTLTWILRDLFPLILGAIHTDASANPISRSILNDRCNDIVGNYIAEENLLGDSFFDIPNEANSDAKNNKGRLLTCLLACHFIGLVERINFKIVATDSTVTVEIA